MTATAKVQMGTGAIASTTTVTAISANTKSASDLLSPMNANETAQARGYLELVQRGRPQGPGRPGRPGNGPHIPRVPPRRPDFPRHDPFPRDPFPRYPIPLPVPRWPSPMPWPNGDLRPCLPGEVPDYYDRYGRALCRSWWW